MIVVTTFMLQSMIPYRLHYSRTGSWFVLVLPLFFICIWIPAGAQVNPQGAISIEEGGRLWIEGSAKIVDYSCQAQQLSGNGNIENTVEPQQNVKDQGSVSISVSIPVRSLKCDKRKMNRDLYQALKADRYPSIHFQLLNARLVDENSDLNETEKLPMTILTTGVLEIAGQKDTTSVMVEGELLNHDRFRVRGRKQISMKTYNIKPPSAMFGLIKASDDLTVYFDVSVKLEEDS